MPYFPDSHSFDVHGGNVVDFLASKEPPSTYFNNSHNFRAGGVAYERRGVPLAGQETTAAREGQPDDGITRRMDELVTENRALDTAIESANKKDEEIDRKNGRWKRENEMMDKEAEELAQRMSYS